MSSTFLANKNKITERLRSNDPKLVFLVHGTAGENGRLGAIKKTVRLFHHLPEELLGACNTEADLVEAMVSHGMPKPSVCGGAWPGHGFSDALACNSVLTCLTLNRSY